MTRYKFLIEISLISCAFSSSFFLSSAVSVWVSSKRELSALAPSFKSLISFVTVILKLSSSAVRSSRFFIICNLCSSPTPLLYQALSVSAK